MGEDLAVVGGLWVALTHPAVFLLGLVVFIVLLIWLLPKIWYLIKRIFNSIRARFTRTHTTTMPDPLTDVPPRRIEEAEIITSKEEQDNG